MIEQNTRIRLVKQLDVTDLAGEKVMIDFESGKYFLLKGSANEIWDILSSSSETTVSEIIKSLMNTYEVSEEDCRTSVISFLNHLLTLDFITCS